MLGDKMGGAGGRHVTEGKSIHYLVSKTDTRQPAGRADGGDGLPHTGFETSSRPLWWPAGVV